MFWSGKGYFWLIGMTVLLSGWNFFSYSRPYLDVVLIAAAGLFNFRNLPSSVYSPGRNVFSRDYEASKDRARVVDDRYPLVDILGK